MLDVSLTGNISIADAFVVLEEEINNAVLTNQLYAETEKIVIENLFRK